MKKVSWISRLRYWFDNTMSRGPIALISWLALFTLVVVVVTALVVWFTGYQDQESLGEQIWSFGMLTLDLDSLTSVPWFSRIAALVIVFTGIFVTSMLIGVLTTGLEEKIEELRKGRSRVLEADHTVLLGWSPQIFPIIAELVIANENQSKPSIVVLGDKDKVEMEEEIKDKVGDTGKTRIVCRRGNPLEMGDLEITNLNSSKSIIILAPPGVDPDSRVIKTMLAITKSPDRRKKPYHIVAEIHNPKYLEVAKIVGEDEIEVVLTESLISRITAQTCRQSGLSIVYSELMDFAGDEIYFQAEPSLIGKSFSHALMAYEDSAIIGIHPQDAQPTLNPPMDTSINEGDRLIAISEDDHTVRVSGRTDYGIVREGLETKRQAAQESEHTLILGWNKRAASLIHELDNYVPSGSSLMVVAEFVEGEIEIHQAQLKLDNQTSSIQKGDPTDRDMLEGLALSKIDHVIVLPMSDTFDIQQADARTLITLIHLRDLADRQGLNFSLVSEMLDIRNRNLAEVAKADDFIVGDNIISLILSQISENKALGPVFSDLFDPEGSEIYLKPAARYVKLGMKLNFYTVVESAIQRSEVALGYRIKTQAHDAAQAYGIVINPEKSAQVTFIEGDKIILLAES